MTTIDTKADDQEVIVMLRLKFKPGAVSDVLPELLPIAALTREETGNIEFQVFRARDDDSSARRTTMTASSCSNDGRTRRRWIGIGNWTIRNEPWRFSIEASSGRCPRRKTSLTSATRCDPSATSNRSYCPTTLFDPSGGGAGAGAPPGRSQRGFFTPRAFFAAARNSSAISSASSGSKSSGKPPFAVSTYIRTIPSDVGPICRLPGTSLSLLIPIRPSFPFRAAHHIRSLPECASAQCSESLFSSRDSSSRPRE